MTTYILTWHPDAYPIEVGYYLEYAEDVANGGPKSHGQWSTGNRTHEIGEGDRVFLFRQGRQRGIVASGYCTSGVFQESHWDGDSGVANYVRINFDAWRPLEDRLTIDELEDKVPGFSWNHLQGSGIHIDDALAAKVEKLWGK